MSIGFNKSFGWKSINSIGGVNPPLKSYMRQWLIGNDGVDTIDNLDIINPEPIITNSYCINFDDSGEIYLPSISFGETITSIVGTSTPSLNGQTISFTTGNLFELVINNGDHLVASTGSGNTLYNVSNPYIPTESTIHTESQIIGDNL